MSFAFDGTTKQITLSPGTVTLVLPELYSRYKDWLLEGNAGFDLAFTTVGGEIPAIPLYLFLENGWRIVPQAADHALSVTQGVLEVQGGGEPFVDPAGSYKIRITRQAPGIAIGYTSNGATGPTAESIATAVWTRMIEAGFSAEALMRLLVAQAAGDATGLDTGNIAFKSLDGTKSRIVGEVVGGERSVTTRDGT